jgi:hypothetical protein
MKDEFDYQTHDCCAVPGRAGRMTMAPKATPSRKPETVPPATAATKLRLVPQEPTKANVS